MTASTFLTPLSAQPSWEKISTSTASSSATISFTGLSSSYIAYMIEITEMVVATNAVDFYAQFGTGGTPTYQTSSYNYASYGYATNTGTLSDAATGQSQIKLDNGAVKLGTGTGRSYNATVILYNPSQSTLYHWLSYQANYLASNGTSYCGLTGNAAWASSTAVTAIKFYTSSGNISSGVFTLYGLIG